MHCIIIEDQPPAQRILKKYIEDMGTLKLQGVFSDAIQAMDCLKTHPVDLMFLDIHLPKISGIDFLKSMAHPPQVILTTAFSEYALESYEFNVVDYLLKPFSFQRFVKAVSKAVERNRLLLAQSPGGRKEIYIKSGYELVKVVIDNILYISSDADYTEIVTPEKKYLSNEPLRFWEEAFQQPHFYRIHRSHIINTSKIKKLVGNQIYLSDSIVLPIGRAYKEDFVKRILY
ncbi:LytR/AlgR family response regulator transcription factor [Pseudozobellia thermophila]|uniref:Two component transcriptional regulator, LytTR family n=1 Tax=Pseudozobellia thermophila TaxID=192903 RepID=A0A1M6JPZ9_9FLAO|nr:LytTR family DNA-binding domain-containing protein [Pseudozobellia thermophila]SHJ48809.1 two component transcriptional regulator, LytTR family [Pseudozobellia thermophila]